MEDKAFSAMLFALFDRQRFEGNEQLAALLRESESRYDRPTLSDDALSFVSAAGEAALPQRGRRGEEDGL